MTGIAAPLNLDETALPFAKADDASQKTELTIEQYASLRAELDRGGAAVRVGTLARYGVAGEDAFVALKRKWSQQFQKQPTDYGKFRAAYDAYSQWLSSRS